MNDREETQGVPRIETTEGRRANDEKTSSAVMPGLSHSLSAVSPDVLYTRRFFQVFAAVMLFMTGVALQYHFGQYIEYIGHGVDTLGRVLSISMIGTLLIRLHVGRWIDRFGCRPTWLAGAVVVAAAVGSIQFAERIWVIVVLRSLWAMATAAVLTTVAVFAAQMASPQRRAEAIGTMGLAGFLGMIVGPTLGDWVFSGSNDVITPYRIFFSASAVCSLLSGSVIFLLNPGKTAPRVPAGTNGGSASGDAHQRPSQLGLMVRHWPGIVLLTSLLFSMVFCLQTLFLERLAEVRGFKDIKVFFLVYGPTAIILRVIFRRLPGLFGRSRTILFGSLLFSGGLFCLIGIRSQWQLIVPALLMGGGHAFIFPSMVDLAAARFPFAHRGTGTALILGAGDLGMLIGFVTLGELIDGFGFDSAIAALAGSVLIGALFFGVFRHGDILHREQRLRRQQGTCGGG